jgi:hypothetical protein
MATESTEEHGKMNPNNNPLDTGDCSTWMAHPASAGWRSTGSDSGKTEMHRISPALHPGKTLLLISEDPLISLPDRFRKL